MVALVLGLELIDGNHKKKFILESIKLFEDHRKEGNLYSERGISKGSLLKRLFQTLYTEMVTMYYESLATGKY